MYININVSLTEDQIKNIEEQTKIEIDNAILEGKLNSTIKEVVKNQIKGIVNEEIQTKGYRKYIAEKVRSVLLEEDIIEDENTHEFKRMSRILEHTPHYLENHDGKPIELSTSNAKDILAFMQAKFQRGDGKGNSDWIPNKMYVHLPKEYLMYLGNIDNYCGWNIIKTPHSDLCNNGNIFYCTFKADSKVKGAAKISIPLFGED